MSDQKVLLVEDLEENRRVIRLLARRMGITLIEAVDGQEGIELAQREKPDVILMDLSLPILDGWTATTRLKADPATAHIPVIALTAHAMAIDEQRARQAGCDGYVAKPIDLASFQSYLRHVLAGGAP
ncbi:MAG: response regulator [Candidatus Sericytochromatia bacterium]